MQGSETEREGQGQAMPNPSTSKKLKADPNADDEIFTLQVRPVKLYVHSHDHSTESVILSLNPSVSYVLLHSSVCSYTCCVHMFACNVYMCVQGLVVCMRVVRACV